ncbi:MAG: hypothetical protein IT528_03445 [Nitrosomonas sp.]|nr:hypothetical protein [Nitrosomonas sp.]
MAYLVNCYRNCVVAMARFLKGTLVRAVWCEFYDADKQRWSKAISPCG